MMFNNLKNKKMYYTFMFNDEKIVIVENVMSITKEVASREMGSKIMTIKILYKNGIIEDVLYSGINKLNDDFNEFNRQFHTIK